MAPLKLSSVSRLVLVAVAAVIATITAAPQASWAQSDKKLPVVAILVGNRPILDWLVTGLRDTGYVAERNFHLEARLTEGRPDKTAQFADEIIALKPAVIVTGAAVEVKRRTAAIPIVLDGHGVLAAQALTLMNSFEHPGGNVTGVVEGAAAERDVRRITLLKETIPGLVRVAVFGPGVKPEVRATAAKLGLQLNFVTRTPADQIEAVFDELATKEPQALWVHSGPSSLETISKIASLAAARKWPSISESRELPASGGLMSYGGLGDARQVASYVDKILKGAKPSELPAEVESTHWQLVVNLKAAKQLGLTIPESVLAQAVEIIR